MANARAGQEPVQTIRANIKPNVRAGQEPVQVLSYHFPRVQAAQLPVQVLRKRFGQQPRIFISS